MVIFNSYVKLPEGIHFSKLQGILRFPPQPGHRHRSPGRRLHDAGAADGAGCALRGDRHGAGALWAAAVHGQGAENPGSTEGLGQLSWTRHTCNNIFMYIHNSLVCIFRYTHTHIYIYSYIYSSIYIVIYI